MGVAIPGVPLDPTWQARALMCLTLVVFTAIDTAIFKWAGPPGAWRRVLQNTLVMAGPLRFPAGLPSVGPPARLFYAVRALQVATCYALAWYLLGFGLEEAVHMLSSSADCVRFIGVQDVVAQPGTAGTCTDALWPRFAPQGQSSVQGGGVLVGCTLAAFVIVPIVLWMTPKTIPEKVRADWAALVGGDKDSEEAQKAAGSPFPAVDEEERYIFEAYGLLPGRAGVQAAPGGSADEPQQEDGTPQRALRVDGLEGALGALQGGTAALVQKLHVNDLDDAKAERLAPALREMRALRVLLSWSRDLTPEGWGVLSGALLAGAAASLRELHVFYLDDAKAERLAPALREMRALRVLVLFDSHRLTPEGWGVLSGALLAGAAASLRKLRLLNCFWDVAKAEALAPALRATGALRVLDLSNNEGLALEGWGALAGALLSGGAAASLEELHLICCDLDDAKAGQLAPALGALPALRRLNLHMNPSLTLSGLAQVPWPGLPRLRVVLRDAARHEASARACPSEVLGVETLKICGLRAFCPALPFCRSLTSLVVNEGPGLEAADWASAAEALASGPAAGTLRRLDVLRCAMDAARGAALAARLGELHALEEVVVINNSAEAQEAVARAVEGRGVRVLRDLRD